MPRQPSATRERMPRVNFTLDPETLRRLARIVAEVPDIASQSAAIRHLARTWEESRPRSTTRDK